MATANLDRLAALDFARSGYTVVRNLVPEGQVTEVLAAIDSLVDHEPIPDGHTGFHFYWRSRADGPDTIFQLIRGKLLAAAEAFVAPYSIEPPQQVQVSLNLPHWDHRPGGPHLDGCNPPEKDGRPGTYSLLAGVMLTDQPDRNMGNIWVWPGTHLENATYFRTQGSDALMASAPYPPTTLSRPEQATGKAGDVYFAHYLLGHNIGGNVSDTTRKVAYFRLHATGHRDRWRLCIRDPLLEYEPVRRALAESRFATNAP